MPELTPVIAGIGVFLGAACGFLLRGLFVPGEIRSAVNKAWRQVEDLHRVRAVEDRRNDTRAF